MGQQEEEAMANGRLTGVAWREWSSEVSSAVSPEGSKAAARTMTAHAALGPSPSLRIADAAVPVLGCARMYVCGITPYETTHVGHAATFVWADVAARVLRLAGAAVFDRRDQRDVVVAGTVEATRGAPFVITVVHPITRARCHPQLARRRVSSRQGAPAD
jgi:hypothetical protein